MTLAHLRYRCDVPLLVHLHSNHIAITSAIGVMYRYWPTSAPLAHEELTQLLITPLYASIAESSLFLAQVRETDSDRPGNATLRKLEDGFVCPTSLDARVEGFVRQHFTIFDLPPPLADQMLASAPRGLRPFTPATMRQYMNRKLKDPKKRDSNLMSSAWGALHSAVFTLDLLAFCLQDLTQTRDAKLALLPGRAHELQDVYLLPLAQGNHIAIL